MGVEGIDVQKSSHVLLQIEKSINTTLIDQLYQSDEVLRFYHDYKRRIIAIDEMR
jgi:soluble cytochrome b562